MTCKIKHSETTTACGSVICWYKHICFAIWPIKRHPFNGLFFRTT